MADHGWAAQTGAGKGEDEEVKGPGKEKGQGGADLENEGGEREEQGFGKHEVQKQQ